MTDEDLAESTAEEFARLRARVSELEAAHGAADALARSLAESSPDNIMLLDTRGTIRFINYTVPDLTVEQVIGTPVFNYVAAEFHDPMRRCFERVRQTGRADRYETTYVADDGDVSHWESRVGPVPPSGEVEGFLVSSSNVSERRKAAADRDRFFNLSLDMLCTAGFDGYFTRLNPAFERILGYDLEELLARPFADFIHPDDRAASQDALQQLIRGEEVIDFENRYRTRDGEYRWLSWRAVSELKTRRIYAVARDVTDAKQLQAQVLHSQKLDAVGQLASGIAHDFNNLVQAIQINAEFARRRSSDASVLDNLDEIQGAAQRANQLTRQLLTFGDRRAPHTTVLEPQTVVRGLLDLLRRLIPDSIEIRAETCARTHWVRAERGQLEQVVLNLCLNARDAMPDGGVLELAVHTRRLDHEFCQRNPWARPGRYVVLSVADTGCGIAPEVAGRVFEPFFTTKAPGTGTGLGLATSFGIVRQHEGLLHFDSAPGRGTTFEVYLPEVEAKEESVPPDSKGTRRGRERRETILVAQDDALLRQTMVRALERGGYNVISAAAADEAMELYRRHERQIDLVVLDIAIHGSAGPTALERIRSLNPRVRAVICSRHETPVKADRTQTAAHAPSIGKAYDTPTLLYHVRRELER